MPLFDIQCTDNKCKNVKEVMLKSSDAELPKCSVCGAECERLVSAPGGINLKGGGYYQNGYSHRNTR